MKTSSRLLFLIIAILFTSALNISIGPLPPLGKFLSPYQGFWQNLVEKSSDNELINLDIPGLNAEVEVVVDEMGVPHIFAQNDHDLYLAQGYFTAKDRLWQMEFQTHFAAGRISEIVGKKGLESDKYQRRMGAVYGAENAMLGMENDPKNLEVLQAYADGVNAYIESLQPKDYPVEYKLLNYAPEKWSPIKTAFFLKNMTFVLASGSNDLYLTNILNKYGKDITDDLFPNYPYLESPIIPEGTPLDFSPLQTPQPAKDFVGKGSKINLKETQEGIGSNNWAVSGEKTLSGMPILSNDPHLTLSLPSIWYQMQLVAPGINVYGVTMPGAPNVIEGFNKEIAWGVTNVGSDVLDWYEIKFKDANMKEYWHDNQWKKTKIRIEEIKIKGGETIFDTVIYTHHGPVVYTEKEKSFKQNIPVGHALKWIAHEKSDEMAFFYNINRAKNYDDYREALTHIASPAQNFAYADNQGNIALWVNGRFPLKYKEQGKFILDGTDPLADWQGYIPNEQNPHVLNPKRGFVSSANQFSTDPSYPYYLDWQYAPSERGRRINERLESMEKITIDSLRFLQMDNKNLVAREVLPSLLEIVNPKSSLEKDAVENLKNWNLSNDAQLIAPTIFENWFENIENLTWEDDFPSEGNIPMKYPSSDRLVYAIKNEPDFKWFDRTNTNPIENKNTIVQEAFEKTITDLSKKYGVIENWLWYKDKATGVRHLLPGLDSFSALDIPIGGGAGIVNATTKTTGPSWRIVVELAKNGQPKAYGVYPGGQSGNPGSPHYDDLIKAWTNGELYPLIFMEKSSEKNSRLSNKYKIQSTK